MRNLSRIIFINSANIPYSDDIYLDGNVHFIGTQGVGKSTILRAILFFYNADTQRLGISVEKQNYTDYYFPYSNSYIVYEVATENDAFCILSFKSMNRVCYRFIHSPYRKEFFIDENRMAYSESDRVRAVLDQHGIEYSRIIYTYDEYRNILYGNSTSPEFSRYSLMESKQYQNIPRTIQNVLLNSKLDAEFIKKTIISSLNEDETAIDLNSYKEHLKNFETRLKDIEEFQKRETRKQAREITLLSQQTSQLQGGLVQNCRELVTAFRKAESILPQWKEKQDRADAGKGKLIRRNRSFKMNRASAATSYRKPGSAEQRIAKGIRQRKGLSEKEHRRDLERSSKKEEWKNRQVGLLEEQRILTSQYMEISTKYKSLIQTLDEQWNKIHEAKIKQLDTLNNTYNERLEEARKEYQRFTDSLYQEFETLSQQLHPLKAEKLSELNAMDYQIKLCRKEIFFEEEQQELKARIQNYANFHTERKNRIAQAQLTIKELTMTWEEEQQKLLKEKDLTFQKLQQEMLQLRPRIDELQAFLDNSKDTLQGWLKENKKGWEENIGKLCDESILWQRGLFPQSTIEGGNSFYGISINLDSIHRPIKSIDDYIAEKENGEKRLEEITAAMQRLQTEKEEVQEQLKRKYQPQIKEQKNLISQIEYELEQLERQYQQDMLDLEEWKKKANEERNTKINQLENEKRKRAAELEGINNKLKNLNKEKTEKLDNLKQAWNQQQQTLATEKKTQAEIIGKEEKEEQRRISSIKAEYEADMQKELHSQGADTERLQDIANQLAQLDKELSFIKENATLVIEYQKDKRDLIDRIPGWQREHDEQKRLLQQERETLRAETSSLQEKIDLLNKELEEAEENVRELQKNLEAYSKISAYDWYKPHQDIFHSETAQTIQTTKTCMELIDELTRQANQFTQVQSKLRKEVNLFTGHFDEDNTFKFRVKFNEDWEYVRFADELHDFVEENRIDEYIRRINNEHWDTFKRISMDTSMLTSSEDDIQDVIREINKGFATCNFVGVIQRIEMKVEESSNRVVNILREIQKYYHDYGYDLSPETNLFSSAKEQLVKEEAITLLRTFIKEIHAYRYDSIRLYDSFELRFRIVENGNDTGFIEKIPMWGRKEPTFW